MKLSAFERWERRVNFATGSGCWEWTGSLTADGYSNFTAPGHTNAHRYSWEHFMGPIPEKLELDHLCRVRHCVNPEHLEPVTHRENLLRGETVAAAHAALTHCSEGHPLSGENLRMYENKTTGAVGRVCRECNKRRGREYRARQRVA